MINLIHVGIFDAREPQNGLRRALRDISTGYTEFDWRLLIPNQNDVLTRLLDSERYNTVFMQIQTNGVISPELVKKYSERGVKFYNFNGDVRIPMLQWFFDVAPYCTGLYSNVSDTEHMRELGHTAHYFQIGFDDNIYRPDGPKMGIHDDIVFMGNNYRQAFPLSKMREDVVLKLMKDFPQQFVVYGSNWPNGGQHTNFRQETEAAIYRGCKMALNINQADKKQYTSDRMFRLMACGSLCLTWKFQDIEKEFTHLHDVVYWSDYEELAESIRHFLAHPEEAKEIADRGCQKVMKEYAWDYRIKKTLINLHYGT